MSALFVFIKNLRIGELYGTMEDKVTIIQTADTTKGTTIKLAPDVAHVEVYFEDRIVSHLIVKMKQ